jgi:ABC-type branched-subunit amino acid transport system ATPase component
MTDPIVQVRNLRKRYGPLIAVDGVSFEVRREEIFGILGPNGAGKTTTLEMLEGLRTADDGSALIDGVDVRRDPRGSSCPWRCSRSSARCRSRRSSRRCVAWLCGATPSVSTSRASSP